jgi:replicative DNA helicase
MEEKRVPPHSLEAEEAVLGAILLDTSALAKVMEILQESHFYSPASQKIYRAILDLFSRNVAPDLVTLNDLLKQNKVLEEIGGSEYLSNVVANVITTANVEHHARVVLDKALKRSVINAAMELLKNGFDDTNPAAEILDYAQNIIFDIKERGLRKEPTHIRNYIMKVLETAEKMRGERLLTGIGTGYYKLDEMTSGFQKGDFIIVAGRPSMGKTAFVLNVAQYAAVKQNLPVAIFSLEMSAEMLVQRLLCCAAEVNSTNFRRGKLSNQDWVNLATAAGNFDKAPIYIDDSPNLSILEIKAKARRLRAENDIQMVVIDYMQMLEGVKSVRNQASRQQEISEISRALKGMAKELSCPVVVVSQLSRSPEHRPDNRPRLADLRESGAIEQDADVVILIYREEFYNAETEKKGIAEMNVAKQRNGPTGMFELSFFGEYSRFSNISLREEAVLEEEGYEPF